MLQSKGLPKQANEQCAMCHFFATHADVCTVNDHRDSGYLDPTTPVCPLYVKREDECVPEELSSEYTDSFNPETGRQWD